MEMETATQTSRQDSAIGENQSVIATLQSELSRKPNNTDLRCDLGVALLREERYDEAVACYKKVLRIDPEHADAHIGMGHVLIGIGSILKLTKRISETTGKNQASTTEFSGSVMNQPPVVSLKPNRADVEAESHSEMIEIDSQADPSSATETTSATRFLSEEVLDHMVAAIERIEISHDPFAHIYLENIFPDEFYTELLDQLPDTSNYKELRHPDAILPNGKSARLEFELLDENVARLPIRIKSFWSKYASLFSSPRLGIALFTKLGLQLHVVSRISLIRDISGYKILPHPDIEEKAVTMQFYLPRDNSRTHLGTCLYEQREKDDFTRVKQFSYSPNSGYSFVVSENSWHGVEKTKLEDGPRDSLMFIYYHARKVCPGYENWVETNLSSGKTP